MSYWDDYQACRISMSECETEIKALNKIKTFLESKVSELEQKIEKIENTYMQEHKEMPKHIREIAMGHEVRIEYTMRRRLEKIIGSLKKEIKELEEDYDSYFRGMEDAEEKLTEV